MANKPDKKEPGKGFKTNKKQKKNFEKFQKGFRSKFGIMKKIISLAFCLWICCSGVALAQDKVGSLKLHWEPVTTNQGGAPCTNLAGYRVYIGSQAGLYDRVEEVTEGTDYEVKNLTVGKKYFVAVSAYNLYNNEGLKSIEVAGSGKCYYIPAQVQGLIEVTVIVKVKYG